MQIRLFIVLANMYYYGISNSDFCFFYILFIVSNMAYDKNTGFVLLKILSHWRPDHL